MLNKPEFADFIFALGWLVIGVATTYAVRRRRAAEFGSPECFTPARVFRPVDCVDDFARQLERLSVAAAHQTDAPPPAVEPATTPPAVQHT